MKKKTFTFSRWISVYIFVFITQGVIAQSTSGLLEHVDFFKNQEKIYQKWLGNSGLDEVLSVHSTIVKEEQLSLNLQFKYTDADSVIQAWLQLKEDFEMESSITLEQHLFYKMVSIMNVPQNSAVVQLYGDYSSYGKDCFFRGIYFREGEVKVAENNCKPDLQVIEFERADFSKAQKAVTKEFNTNCFNNEFSTNKTLELIYDYAQSRFGKNYGTTNCKGRKPNIQQQELSKYTLRFSVDDLCLEVLDDKSWVCEGLKNWFEYDCNWIQREKLIFLFTYEPTSKGFKITGKVDGFVGNGFFESIGESGYYNMDIDKEFYKYLENYADVFSNDVRRYLRDKITQTCP